MMLNICDDDCDLVIKVILVKEVMSCDVSPVAMFGITILLAVLNANTKQANIKIQEIRIQKISLSSWDDILPLLNLLLAFFKVP